MAKRKLGLPFPPLVNIDTDEPILSEYITKLLSQRLDGASICLRSENGHPDRGGYFFHIQLHDRSLDQYQIFNFEKVLVEKLSLSDLTSFINHCAGLAFDEAMFQFCQDVVNFRLDPEPSAE